MMLKITGDPVKGGGEKKEEPYIPPSKGVLDKTADVRDLLNNFIGYGYSDLSDDNARAVYSSLVNKLGEPMARKMIQKVIIHNQRPDLLKASPETRIKSFYHIGSSDPDVSKIMQDVKTFGYGIGSDLQNSAMGSNRALVGNLALSNDPGAGRLPTPKIMLKVGKNMGQ